MIELKIHGGGITFVNPAQIVEVTDIDGGALVWMATGPKKTTMKASEVLELMTEPAVPVAVVKKSSGLDKYRVE